MVCIYCGSPTQVKNSRLFKRGNTIWRRRACSKCNGVFTTREQVELGSSFVVRSSNGGLSPFSQNILFVSIYESCKHRAMAADDAGHLTQLVLGRLTTGASEGSVIETGWIVDAAIQILERFDPVAAAVYTAYYRPL